jgi:DNA processing protein
VSADLDRLRLARTEGVGPITYRRLLRRFRSATEAIGALPDLARAGGRAAPLTVPPVATAELERVHKLGARLLFLNEEAYPPLLALLDDAPAVVTVLGDIRAFAPRAVALVGSRNASVNGQRLAETLAQELAAAGLAVVSGLARGIDACAHRASLATGTIGVLAGGLDRPYPPENVALIESIVEKGAVLSEMPFGYEPRGRDFPRRNRIVSGLSLGTVVVEAARRSGSLITATFAQEQNREVFAVPGSPLDPRAEGANDLIRQGATLCTSAQDIFEVLAPLAARGATRYDLLFEPDPAPFHELLWDESEELEFSAAPAVPMFSSGSVTSEGEAGEESGAQAPPRVRVETLLGPSPVVIDDLARAAGCTTGETRLVLQELEIEGRIERHGGDRVSLIGQGWRR